MARVRERLPGFRPAAAFAAAGLVGAIVIAPAVFERVSYERAGARWIVEQRIADAEDGAAFVRLAERAARSGPGRVYAGLRSRSGSIFEVGRVPGYLWLLRVDVDGLGFTRPTWSLMSGAEARFDPNRAGHYRSFGVRYVIAPLEDEPIVPATLEATAEPFGLWQVDEVGPLRVVDTISPITADRDDLTSATSAFLRSDLPDRGRYPTIAFGGRHAAPPTVVEGDDPSGPAGEVLENSSRSSDGFFSGRIRAVRPAVVALAASFDPGWRAFVDGRERPVQMLAPALVGVAVSAGEHDVAFVYRPVSAWWYALWFGAGAGAILVLGLLDRRDRRRRARSAAMVDGTGRIDEGLSAEDQGR